MGETLKFICPERKEYLSFKTPHKSRELLGNSPANKMVTAYILMHGNRENVTVSLVGSEYDQRYDDIIKKIHNEESEWRDATVDVLTHMLENGWIPDNDNARDFMVNTFVDANRVKQLNKWLNKLYGETKQ